MSVEELKQQLAALPRKKQDEVIAYVFHLRHANDRDYGNEVGRRLDDKNPAHWLSPDEFERKLDRRQTP